MIFTKQDLNEKIQGHWDTGSNEIPYGGSITYNIREVKESVAHESMQDKRFILSYELFDSKGTSMGYFADYGKNFPTMRMRAERKHTKLIKLNNKNSLPVEQLSVYELSKILTPKGIK